MFPSSVLFMLCLLGPAQLASAPASQEAPCKSTWHGGFGPHMGVGGVYSYEQFDDGSGSALFMGGKFSKANGVQVKNIVRFGVVYLVRSLDPEGDGQDLYLVGSFVSPVGDTNMAHWGGCNQSFETYCTAGTSAAGCQAAISAAGTASASAASAFSLLATAVEGQKHGLFFFGTNGQQANPWGNGTSYQCVVPPVNRAGTLAGSGTLGLCDGSFAQDLNALWCPTCPKPAKYPGAGALVQAQLWYRDPASTSNQSTSLSDAIEFSVAP